MEKMALPWRQQQKQPQEFRRIPLGQIRKNPHQPRKIFDPQALQSLADSIRQYGIITPLTVRELAEGYELVCYLPIGIPAAEVKGPGKKPFDERAWFNCFGGR